MAREAHEISIDGQAEVLTPNADFSASKDIKGRTMNRRDFLKLAGVGGASLVLAACGAGDEVVPTIAAKLTEALSPTPPSTNSDPTSKPEQTETPNPLKPGKGGGWDSNPDTEAFYDSPEGQKQRQWLESWMTYWSTAQESQRSFAAGSTRVYEKPIADPLNSKSIIVVLESPDYQKSIILPPVVMWEGMIPAPEATPNHNVPEGYGPLLLSTTSGPELEQYGIPTGSVLGYVNKEFVMVSPEGVIVGKVNKQTTHWEPVTPEPPKPTETPEASHLTMEDWKKVFSGIADNGQGGKYDRSIIFSEKVSTIYTDPNTIQELKTGEIAIFNSTGEIMMGSKPNFAAQKVMNSKDNFVLVPKEGHLYDISSGLIEAAFNQYNQGKSNFIVTFGEYDRNYPVQVIGVNEIPHITESGRVISPVVKMPPFFTAFSKDDSVFMTSRDIKDPNFWLDELTKAGATTINVYGTQ
jgi:hypothetical protein